MTATATYPPHPSAVPAPVRTTDVFDFLHTPKCEEITEDCISVKRSEKPELLALLLETPDGRCLRRNVPAKRWQDKAYRGAVIKNMWALVA